jgi:diguanylate cyclase (GGDEF)-like protein
MNIFKWLIFFIIAFVAFLPLTRIRIFNVNKRYFHFKYLSILLFSWTVLSFLEYTSVDANQIYYLTLAVYPTIFALTATLFISIMYYLGKKVPKYVLFLIVLILVLELVVSFTNQFHHLMMDLTPGPNLILTSFEQIPRGIGFFVHTVLCYSMLVAVIVLILYKFIKDFKRDNDIVPFLTMVIGIILGIGFNMIHIFVRPFSIDPTYIAFVLLITLLYFVLYIRDLRLIIELGRNEFILDNFREMYVICNHRNIVVDASEEFLESFEVDITKEMSFDELMNHLKEKAVIYENQTELSSVFYTNKRYLHMLRKLIHLPLFRYQGSFYLFYDESNVRKHINDVEYVKSHDLMTELFNRNYFEEIKKDIDKNVEQYTLIMLDLDGLKFYNDYLGHASGDNMLIAFSNKLKEVADKFEMIPIRMGGDEFLLISLNPKPKAIELAIKEVLKLSEGKNSDKKILFSYGTASKEKASEDLEKVFSKADDGMYKMKIEQETQKLELQKYLKNKKRN